MSQAKTGDTVKVHYVGTLKDGTEFDSSLEREPLIFTLGEKAVIPGFEDGIMGMKSGDSKTVEIPAEQAYGPHRKELEIVVNKGQFPENMEPELGRQYQLDKTDGSKAVMSVTEITDRTITLDGNHPLAGKTLFFDIRLVEIVG